MPNDTAESPTPQASSDTSVSLIRLAENAAEANQVFRRLIALLDGVGYSFVATEWRDTPYVIFRRGTNMREGQRFFTLADAMEAAIGIIGDERARNGGGE